MNIHSSRTRATRRDVKQSGTPRILHVTQPTEAGVANVVRGLAQFQRSLGLDVAVASPDSPIFRESLVRLGVDHVVWRASRSPLAPSLAAELTAMRSIAARQQPDLVHLHSSKAGLVGRLALHGTIPTVFQPHAWADQAASRPVRNIARAWEKGAARYTSAIVCGSEAEAAHGRELGVSRLVVIPNGIDPEEFSPRPRAAARARLGIPADARLVVCVGRLAQQKGQDSLLSIWPRIERKVPGSMLALVGAGPLETMLRDAARGLNVKFDTGCNDPRDWYAASHVVVAPSRWEGAALVPLEAMAMGRSVVGFAVGGLEDAVPYRDAVVRAGDLDGLLLALTQYLMNAGENAEELNREHVTAKYRSAMTYEQITALTLDILTRASR